MAAINEKGSFKHSLGDSGHRRQGRN